MPLNVPVIPSSYNKKACNLLYYIGYLLHLNISILSNDLAFNFFV